MKRVLLGRVYADCVDGSQALERVAALVRAGRGGFVVTPNIDHVVLAEKDERLRAAYAAASLSLIDGMPLLWIAGLLGHPLPERIAGSDFIRPLVSRGAREGWRFYFLGSAPGVAEKARDVLSRDCPGLVVAGCDAPPVGFEQDAEQRAAALARLRAASPQIVLVALGCPKQEILMHEWRDAMAPAVALGIGAGLDFIAGVRRRAPAWVARAGLEWAFRLAQEPRRMAGRYLVRDVAIAGVVLRMLGLSRARRAVEV